MIKVFHCADIHLDSPFALFSPSESEKRRSELRAAFVSALDFAREKNVDIFIISGDLFDGEYVTRDTRDLILREFSKCRDMKIFISPGNHDPFTAGSVYATTRFPENVHVFGREREVVSLDDKGVDVYGFGFVSKNCAASPVAGWSLRDKSKINLLVCHGDTSGANSPYGPITKGDIASSGFDYIALGHIHKPSGLQNENGVFYCYPGCIEGRSFDELGYHGAMYGTIEKSNVDMRFTRFSRTRYEWISVDITGAQSKLDALDIIKNAIKPYSQDTALRVSIVGEVDNAFVMHPSELFTGYNSPYFLEFEDKTFVRPNLALLEGENTLKGVFCKKVFAQMEKVEKDSQEYRMLSLALKYGIAALDDRSVADYSGGLGE